jgi:hypothetical protein
LRSKPEPTLIGDAALSGVIVITTVESRESSRSERLRCRSRHMLLQLRVFGLRLFQNGDVGVGVLPEGEEIPVGG